MFDKSITVFATSNAIMKEGYLRLSEKKAQSLGYTFINHSIGGSSSCYGALCANTMQDRSVTIFDFLLNDEFLIDIDALTEEQSFGQHLALVRTLVNKGNDQNSIVLLLIQKSSFKEGKYKQLRHKLRELFDRIGIKYIDIAELLPVWMLKYSDTLEEAYVDDRHFSYKYQALIGEEILKAIDTPVKCSDILYKKAILSLPDLNYQLLKVDTRSLNCSQKGTSLVKQDVFEVPENMCIRIYGQRYLAGCLFWSDENSGSLIIESKHKKRLLLRRGHENIFLFDTFSPPIFIDGEVSLLSKNDKTVPYLKAISQKSSIYSTENSVSKIVYFVGCDYSLDNLMSEKEKLGL